MTPEAIAVRVEYAASEIDTFGGGRVREDDRGRTKLRPSRLAVAALPAAPSTFHLPFSTPPLLQFCRLGNLVVSCCPHTASVYALIQRLCRFEHQVYHQDIEATIAHPGRSSDCCCAQFLLFLDGSTFLGSVRQALDVAMNTLLRSMTFTSTSRVHRPSFCCLGKTSVNPDVKGAVMIAAS